MSLADPKLPSSVREDITGHYAAAKQRKQLLEAKLQEDQGRRQYVDGLFDSQQVIRRLQSLDELLAGANSTLVNLELMRHIERIDCHRDGRVVMRGTLLGLFEGAVELLSRQEASVDVVVDPVETCGKVKPRRRGRLRIDDLSADAGLDLGVPDTVLDPNRFQGLPEQFMWEERFYLSRKLSWAEEHAADVAGARAEGLTMQGLAERFGKTVPTIRAALRCAARVDESVARLPRKMPRSRWHEDHALEVAAQKAEGLGTNELAAHFGKSDTTIRAALAHAEKLSAGGSQAEVA
jgi:hypothetical protein